MKKAEEKNLISAAILLVFSSVLLIISLIVLSADNGGGERTVLRGDSSKVLSDRPDTLIIGTQSQVRDIHPYKYDDDVGTYLKKLVFTPLLEINKEGGTAYRAAKEIIFSDGGRKANVTLDTGRKFSNGDNITAENVKASYEWFIGQETSYSSLLANIEDISVLSGSELAFSFKLPDIKNIEVFDIPLVYDPIGDGSDRTFIGSGDYVMTSMALYSDITLTAAAPDAKYKEVLLQKLNYGSFEEETKKQQADIFAANKGEHFDMLKNSGAYDVIESEEDYGYYLLLNIPDEQQRAAICKAVSTKKFFDDSFDQGVYPAGIVSAYIKAPNFRSIVSGGSFKDADGFTVLCGYDALSLSVFEKLSEVMAKNGITVTRILGDNDGVSEYEEDMMVYYGSYKQLITSSDASGFFNTEPNLDAKDYYPALEKYLSERTDIIPLQRDTGYTAVLAGTKTDDILD